MSLTGLIRTDPEVRARLAEAITRSPLPRMPLLIAPQSKRYNVTGTAFDYLLRFALHRRAGDVAVHAGWWVAEIARPRGRGARKTAAFLKDARALVGAFVQGDGDVRDVALACTVLAKLDLIVRSGWVDPELLTPLPDIAEELLALLDIVPFGELQAQRQLVLNPTFDSASRAVGGADADMVVDDLLLDIKTTQEARASLDEVRQLVGYAVLARLAGLHALDSPVSSRCVPGSVRRVGLYYARYGRVVTYDLRELVRPEAWTALLLWWELRFPRGGLELPWPVDRTRAAMERWLEEGVEVALAY